MYYISSDFKFAQHSQKWTLSYVQCLFYIYLCDHTAYPKLSDWTVLAVMKQALPDPGLSLFSHTAGVPLLNLRQLQEKNIALSLVMFWSG